MDEKFWDMNFEHQMRAINRAAGDLSKRRGGGVWRAQLGSAAEAEVAMTEAMLAGRGGVRRSPQGMYYCVQELAAGGSGARVETPSVWDVAV